MAVLALLCALAGWTVAGCSAAPPNPQSPIPKPPAAAIPAAVQDADSSLGSAKPLDSVAEPGANTAVPATPANAGDRDELSSGPGAVLER